MGWWVWELWAEVCFGSRWLCMGVGGCLGQPGGGSSWLTGGWWGVGLGCPGTVEWVGWGIEVFSGYVSRHVSVKRFRCVLEEVGEAE